MQEIKDKNKSVDLVIRKIRRAMMDIFSTTSKQVETATTPKVANSTQVRNIEQSSDSNKVNQQSQSGSKETLKKTVDDLNDQMDILNTNISFGFNDKIDMMYIDVKEKSSGKIIRKIPTEEAMSLSEKMKEIVGIIFDKKG